MPLQPSDIVPELLKPYDVRHTPAPAPTAGIFDEKSITICFNVDWASHIDGVLQRLLYRDAWDGTDEQVDFAIDQVQRLIAEIKVKNMCCCGDDKTQVILHQVDPVTGEPEISIDDGETWTPDPESVYSKATRLPAPAILDTDLSRCEAANNVIVNMKDLQQKFSEHLGTIENVEDFMISIIAEIVAILLTGIVGALLLPLIVALIPKVLGVVRAIFTMTSAEYDALFTEEVWGTALCVVYCSTPDNLEYTQGDWLAIKNQLRSKLGGTDNSAGASLAAMVDVWSVVGLKNASRLGVGGEGNCDDCSCSDEWWYEFDFTVAEFDQFFVPVNQDTEFPAQGEYVAGEGWKPVTIGGACYCVVLGHFAAVGGLDLIGYVIEQTVNAATQYNRSVDFNATRDNYDGITGNVIDGSEAFSGFAGGFLHVDPIGGRWIGAPDAAGLNVRFTRLVLHGKGINPFGADNYVYDPLSP